MKSYFLSPKYLAYWLGSYYRVYHAIGNTDLISHIQQAAASYPDIADEIAKKIM